MKFSNSFYYDLDFAETSEKWVKELFEDVIKEIKKEK